MTQGGGGLLKKIVQAVEGGQVNKQFRAADFDFLSRSPSFISKHAIGNGRYSEYFRRISRGLYELK